jgi:hypothetical protein
VFDGLHGLILTNESLEIEFRAAIEEKYHGILRVENLHAKRLKAYAETDDEKVAAVSRGYSLDSIGATLVFNYSEAADLFQQQTMLCSRPFCMKFRSHNIICPHMHEYVEEVNQDGETVMVEKSQAACDFSVDYSFMSSPAGMASMAGAFILLLAVAFFIYKNSKRVGTGKKVLEFGGNAFNNPMYSLGGTDSDNPLYAALDFDELPDSGEGLYDTPEYVPDGETSLFDLQTESALFDENSDSAYFEIPAADDAGGGIYDGLHALPDIDSEKKNAKAAKKAAKKKARLAAKAAKLGNDSMDANYLEMGGADVDEEGGYLEMGGADPDQYNDSYLEDAAPAGEGQYLEMDAAPAGFATTAAAQKKAAKKAAKKAKKAKAKKQPPSSWEDMSGGMYDDGDQYMEVGNEDGFGF